MSIFKTILILLTEQTKARILKVALKKDNEIFSGKLYDTHYDLIFRFNIDAKDNVEYGFITPENIFLTREESLQWIKTETPEIEKQYKKIIKKAKPTYPEFGYDKGLESIGYLKALGINGI